jgi:hypothetical protein
MEALPYAIETGPKQECREAIVKAAQERLDIPEVFLSLPAENAYCIKTFRRAFPQAICIGVECDPKVFDGMDITPRYLTTLANYSKTVGAVPNSHIDVAFIDYKSFVSRESLAEISDFVGNRNLFWPGRKSVVAVTFMKALRYDKEGILELVREKLFLDDHEGFNDISTIRRLVTSTLRTCRPGVGHKLLEEREYRAIPSSPDMYFILLELEFSGG